MTTPADVARALVVLAHPDTYWMTGNVIGVDGGETSSGDLRAEPRARGCRVSRVPSRLSSGHLILAPLFGWLTRSRLRRGTHLGTLGPCSPVPAAVGCSRGALSWDRALARWFPRRSRGFLPASGSRPAVARPSSPPPPRWGRGGWPMGGPWTRQPDEPGA
jgi:hypothetical protein